MTEEERIETADRVAVSDGWRSRQSPFQTAGRNRRSRTSKRFSMNYWSGFERRREESKMNEKEERSEIKFMRSGL